jgi:glycine/D-amino acid oxidase-like deaminating enzyme
VSITKDMRDEIASIRIFNIETHSETDLPCTKVLIAAGAWSPQVFSTLFPRAKKKLPISSLAGHSLVLRSPRWKKENEEKGCHAIFTTDDEGYSPEIFSRSGEEIYIAGLNSSSLALPDLATGSVVNEDAVNKLMHTSKRLLGVDELKVEEPKVEELKRDELKRNELERDELKGEEPKVDDPKVDALKVGDLEVLRKGLCFRPVTNRGTPFLTKIPNNMLGDVRMIRGAGESGVWLAAGHGPWGISLSLGSGKVMAEMIQGRPPSVDIRLGL